MKMLAIGGIELAFLFASACSAAPMDSEDALNVRETACKALGTCQGMHLSSPSPPTSVIPLPLYPSSLSPSPSITLSLATSPSTTTSPWVLKSGIDPYLDSCSDDQKAKVKEAWTEAGELADAHERWTPPAWYHPGAWQAAQSMYLGSDSRNDKRFLGRGPLKRSSSFTPSFDTNLPNSKAVNIDRQYAIHFIAPVLTYAYFYCDEQKLPKKKERMLCRGNPHALAYTFNDVGTLWSAHYLVFCPTFFSDELTSLAHLVQIGQDRPDLADIMDTWLAARARVIFHETYHWAKTVAEPPLKRRPEVYDPKDVYELARVENTKGAETNAESWTQAAMAMFVQQRFKLRFPPVPKEYAPPDARSDPSVMKIATENLISIFLDRMPDWFVPPVVQGASAFKPDMRNVVQLSSIGRMSQNVSITVI